jgi:hypothetical protein
LTQKDEGSLRSQAPSEVAEEDARLPVAADDFRDDIAQVLAEQWNNVRDPDGHIAAYDMWDEARAVYEEVVAPALDTLAWLHAEAVWNCGQANEQITQQHEINAGWVQYGQRAQEERRGYADKLAAAIGYDQRRRWAPIEVMIQITAERFSRKEMEKAILSGLMRRMARRVHEYRQAANAEDDLLDQEQAERRASASESVPATPNPGEWCEKCGTYVSGSHYHCAKCGQRSGMLGHSFRPCPAAADPSRDSATSEASQLQANSKSEQNLEVGSPSTPPAAGEADNTPRVWNYGDPAPGEDEIGLKVRDRRGQVWLHERWTGTWGWWCGENAEIPEDGSLPGGWRWPSLIANGAPVIEVLPNTEQPPSPSQGGGTDGSDDNDAIEFTRYLEGDGSRG